jgi:hypothetical protein
VKADRWAAALLAGLFAAGLPAAGQTYSYKIGRSTAVVVVDATSDRKMLAGALAQQMEEVRKTFDANRRLLRLAGRPGTGPAYPRQEVADLIAHTGEDLDRAIANVRPAGLEPLRAWAAGEIRGIQEKLAAAQGRTAALAPGFSAPRAVAVVASLGTTRLAELASVAAGAPRRETVAAGTADGLLDEVGQVINRLLFLAAHDDLEVTLWVGSTPETHAAFRFWPEGQIRGSAPAPTILRTNGKKERVLRGLYDYSAAWAKGAVTQVVEYPGPAGPAAARLSSERLDLVNGSSFFCCRFDEQYCHHVNDSQDCRP